jgi:hypothetical protein
MKQGACKLTLNVKEGIIHGGPDRGRRLQRHSMTHSAAMAFGDSAREKP